MSALRTLLCATLSTLACSAQRYASTWLCLEDCGASASEIAADLAQLATPGVFTNAAFEAYDLLADGTVGITHVRSRVSGAKARACKEQQPKREMRPAQRSSSRGRAGGCSSSRERR